MKKAKIMTVLLAASLFAGCGNIDEEITSAAGNATESEVSAVTPVSDSIEASPDSSEPSSESESAENEEIKDLDGAAGYIGTYINDNNCIIISGIGILDDEDEHYENIRRENIADKQLLYYSAERVIDQYNCIANRDKRGFFDSIDYSGLFKSKDTAMFWAIGFFDEQDDYYSEEGGMLDYALDYSYYLVGEKLYAANDKYPEDDNISNTPYTREEVLAEYREIMDEAAEKATFENSEAYIDEHTCFNRLLRRNGSITNEEYFASREKFRLEPSDDTIYIINMFNGGVSTGNAGTDIRINVTVVDGDYAYEFGECNLWLDNDGDRVMPFEVAVCENLYKGKTRGEIEAEKTEDIRHHFDQYAVPTPAEAAYEGAWYHFSEGLFEGSSDDDKRTIWQKMTDFGSYALSVSDEGLHITPHWDGDSMGIGDDAIIYTMNDYGYDSGTVWVRPEPDGSGDFYVIYESTDGQREEYHYEQGSWY